MSWPTINILQGFGYLFYFFSNEDYGGEMKVMLVILLFLPHFVFSQTTVDLRITGMYNDGAREIALRHFLENEFTQFVETISQKFPSRTAQTLKVKVVRYLSDGGDHNDAISVHFRDSSSPSSRIELKADRYSVWSELKASYAHEYGHFILGSLEDDHSKTLKVFKELQPLVQANQLEKTQENLQAYNRAVLYRDILSKIYHEFFSDLMTLYLQQKNTFEIRDLTKLSDSYSFYKKKAKDRYANFDEHYYLSRVWFYFLPNHFVLNKDKMEQIALLLIDEAEKQLDFVFDPRLNRESFYAKLNQKEIWAYLNDSLIKRFEQEFSQKP